VSTRLVILGLLRDRPLYGYEIKHVIEEHMGDWTSIAFGSIYFALGKLQEEALVEQVATEKVGARPSRSVYQITDAGRQEFLRLLREAWTGVEQLRFDIDLAIFFMDSLAPGEAARYMEARIHRLQQALQHISEHRAEQMQQQDIPRRAGWIFDHSYRHTLAELEWSRSVLASMQNDEPS